MKRADNRRAILYALLALFLSLFLPVAAAGEDPSAALAASGWEEHTPGRWNRLPERKVEAGEKGFSGKFVLSPGTGVSWEKRGTWDLRAGAALTFEFHSDGTNPSSEDYREYGAHFPVSVTAVFGEDSVDLPWKTRLAGFFRKVWSGFPPGGIRLTYAFGNRVPVGSMYRLGEEETVFILAGDEEKGRTIQGRRNLKEDFLAAYGRPPKGPVTRIIVRAERPSREKGNLSGGVVLALPGP